MNELTKESLIQDNQIELDSELIDKWPLIQPVLFVEFNPVDKHIMENPSQRSKLLMDLFTQPITDYGNEIPFVQFLYQNGIKVSIATYPSDINNTNMIEVFSLLNKWNITPEFWIGLDDSDGCYTNHTNLEKTMTRIHDTLRWLVDNNVEIPSIGINLEYSIDLRVKPPIKDILYYIKGLRNTPNINFDRFNNFLLNLSKTGVKINQYRSIKDFGISKKIKHQDKSIYMYYSSITPRPIADLLIKFLYNPSKEIVATGIIERDSYNRNDPNYTPGRMFKQSPTNHLSMSDLYRDINETYRKYLKGNKKSELLPLEMYFFALDNPQVAWDIRNTINRVANDLHKNHKL